MTDFLIDYAEAAEDLAAQNERRQQQQPQRMKTFKGHTTRR